jgi:hypothetical protein
LTVGKEKIREALAGSGWEIAEVRTYAEHWVDEIWLVRSTWSPTDFEVYLTFEIDGQSRSRDTSSVWAINASLSKPIDWSGDGKGDKDERASTGTYSIHLPITKEKHLESLVAGLDDLRNGRESRLQ